MAGPELGTSSSSFRTTEGLDIVYLDIGTRNCEGILYNIASSRFLNHNDMIPRLLG